MNRLLKISFIACLLTLTGCGTDSTIDVFIPSEDDEISGPGNTDTPGNTDDPGNTDNPGNTDEPGNTNNPGNTEPAVTDEDPDKDGLTTSRENELGTDPTKNDTDGDGLNDGKEVEISSDPTKADTDDDGLNDAKEVEIGTDPTKADTDGDGLNDAKEVEIGTDPTKADPDGDGLNDAKEVEIGTDPTKADSDGDGLGDNDESSLGTDPKKADTDGDGASDLVENLFKTSPTNAEENPAANGIVVFETPYDGTTVSPTNSTLSFVPVIQKIDLYYAIGWTSAGSSFPTHVNSLPTILKNMTCKTSDVECKTNADCVNVDAKKAYICGESGKCILQSTASSTCFADIWTGYGMYGNVNTFVNEQSLQNDHSATQNGLANKPASMNAYNYSQPPACIIKGTEYCTNDIKCYEGNDRFGCVGYRPDAIKTLVHVSDYYQKDTKTFPTSKMKSVAKILTDNDIRYIGISQRYCGCNDGMKQLACYANACAGNKNCATCESLPDCSNSDKGVLNTMYFSPANNRDVAGLIKSMGGNRVLKIEPRAVDVDKDASKLVASLKAATSGNDISGIACKSAGKIAANGDNDEISDLKPATTICYTVSAKDKQQEIKATNSPQVLEARIQVTAENSVLNSSHVYFVIPPDLNH